MNAINPASGAGRFQRTAAIVASFNFWLMRKHIKESVRVCMSYPVAAVSDWNRLGRNIAFPR